MAPLVTIAVPAYRSRFLRASLASAVAQTWTDREIIVGPDGEDPEIDAICAAFPEVRVLPRQTLGMWPNAERCFAAAEGRYIKMLFDDDLLEPDCVRRMVEVFEAPQGPELTLVGSRRRVIDAADRQLAILGGVPNVERNALVPRGILWPLVLRGLHNFIGELTTVMMRRADLEALGPQPMQGLGPMAQTQRDLRLFLALNAMGAAYIFHDPLSAFRVHGQQSSAELRRPEHAKARLAAWLDLVELAWARGLIEAPRYRHGLRQVDRLRLRMIGEHAELAEVLEPIEARLRMLTAEAPP